MKPMDNIKSMRPIDVIEHIYPMRPIYTIELIIIKI
jgi:hypothetical protein